MTTSGTLLKRLERLNQIGVALSGERDTSRLLELILLAAKELAGADAGTLYLVEDGRLKFEILRTDSLGIALGGTAAQKPAFPPIPLCRPDGAPNEEMVVACAVIQDRTINIEDAYDSGSYDFSGTRLFDSKTGYRSKSFLTVPMKNHENEIIGVLQLINAQDRSGNIVPFAPASQRLVESLASQAAIALTNRQLIDQLEYLFESFVHLINAAIDEKSPYTGAHCERVPVLTMMLAEAADRDEEGPLKDFHMSDRDRYELKMAGLLHDCGKITTPVHVVDKATKLQTIFDRIELVATRFEVLRRDLEIACLKGEISTAERDRRIESCHEDLAFLRSINTGGEFMPPEQQARVLEISRHMLRDADGNPWPLLSADECENLCVAKGTLTAAERDVINHHIVTTISMLEALPWPRHLQNVPEYAGGHHERMDGKGYPRGLRREQMSLQARMMGIADVFEALTASDRPYKPAMKLSQATGIMRNMAASGHIDPDLFDVFMRQQVYLQYAREYLNPDQLDMN